MSRVWQALCDPAEVVRWDSGVTQALNAPPDYPQPGQHVRWAYGSRLWHVLHDRPQEVVKESKLRSLLNFGPYALDETHVLTETPEGCRIELQVVLRVRLPIVGRLVEQVWAGAETRRGLEASLAGLKRWCEDESSPLR